MKRKVYHVVPDERGWCVRRGRARYMDTWHPRKVQATARARSLAIVSGMLAQVVVHGRNGKIQFEWTYGKDPRRTRG